MIRKKVNFATATLWQLCWCLLLKITEYITFWRSVYGFFLSEGIRANKNRKNSLFWFREALGSSSGVSEWLSRRIFLHLFTTEILLVNSFKSTHKKSTKNCSVHPISPHSFPRESCIKIDNELFSPITHAHNWHHEFACFLFFFWRHITSFSCIFTFNSWTQYTQLRIRFRREQLNTCS